MLQNFLDQAYLNYSISQMRNQEIAVYPIQAIQRNLDVPARSPRHLELPEGLDDDLSQLLGAVSLPLDGVPQKGPMWADKISKDFENTPGPSSASSFFPDSNTFPYDENNISSMPSASNVIDLNWSKNQSDNVDIEDDPARLIDSFLNSTPWTESVPSNTLPEMPAPLTSPFTSNTIIDKFNFGVDSSIFHEPQAQEPPVNLEQTSPNEGSCLPEDQFLFDSSDSSLPPNKKAKIAPSEFCVDEIQDEMAHSVGTGDPYGSYQPLAVSPHSTGSSSGAASSISPTSSPSIFGQPSNGTFSIVSHTDGSASIDIDGAIVLTIPKESKLLHTLDRDKLIDMPVEEFNLLLQKARLNETGIAYMKEWRRKGKNKKAAQIARKRKHEEMDTLDVQVTALKKVVSDKEAEKMKILHQLKQLKARSEALEDQLLSKYSVEKGADYSRRTHRLFFTGNQETMHAFVVPCVAGGGK